MADTDKCTNPDAQFSAIVAGATGAIGRELVAQLAANPRCSKVIGLTRRSVTDITKEFPGLNENDSKKVNLVPINWDLFPDGQEQLFEGVTVAFSCLGASRWFPEIRAKLEAASSEEEKDDIFVEALNRIDKKYMVGFGHLALKSGAKHFQEVSARSADSSKEGGGFNVYGRVKGEADDLVQKELTAFPNGASIIKPGFLGRGELSKLRPNELKWEAEGRVGIPVSVVAKGMLAESERRMANPDSSVKHILEPEIISLAGWTDPR